MNPPAALRRLPAGADHRVRRIPVARVVAVVLVCVALFGLLQLVAPPRFVHRMSIENPTPYQLQVEVTGRDHDGWTAIGTVEPGRTTNVGEVYDVGDDWVFRFTSQTLASRDVVFSRNDLAHAGWHVAIPPSVGARFRDAGTAPPP